MENISIQIDEQSKNRPILESSMIIAHKLPHSKIPPGGKIYLTAKSDFKKVVSVLANLKIEVLTFVYMFAYIIRSVSSLTMIMDKVCLVHKQFPEDLCANLHDEMYKDQKKEVETMANNYHLYHTLIQMIPAACLASFIGPWSDMYGRKLPIIMSLIGIMLDGVGSTFSAIYLKSRVEYYLIPAAFTGFSGGFITIFTVVYSYITDKTPQENRTLKYAFMEMSIGLGAPLGSLAGGWIYKFYGYVPVFLTSVGGHLFGLIWVIFLVDETRGLDSKDHWTVKLRNFFSFERLMESIRATMKQRPNKGRKQIWLLLLAMSMVVLALMGTVNIAFLYTFHHYHWSNTKYSTVSSIFSVINLFVMIIVVPLLTKKYKVGDATIGILGVSSSITKSFIIAFASKEWLYYIASFTGLVSGLSTLAGRARISKIVSKDDLGKVFAFLSTVESLVPIAASALVTQLYNSTVGIHPDPSYLGLGSVLFIALAVYIWLGCSTPRNYDNLQEEKADSKDLEETFEKSSAL